MFRVNRTKEIKYYYGGSVNFEEDSKLFNTYFSYPALKTCDWFKAMSVLHPDLPENFLKEKSAINKKNILKRLTESLAINKKLFSVKTAKSCPAIIDHLNHCIVLKAPCEFEIKFGEEDIEYEVSNPELMSIAYHPPVQYKPKAKSKSFKTKGNVFSEYVNAKIVFPFVFKTNKIPSTFMDPFFHNPETGLKVVQGSFMKEYAKNHTFQVNTFGKRNTIVRFKKDDPIAYIWYPEKVSFVRSNKPLSTPIMTSFEKVMTTAHFK